MAIDSSVAGDRAARYVTAGLWQNKLITDSLDAHVQRIPDKEAIVDRWGRLTWRQLSTLVDKVASGLRELGMGHGDVMGVQLPNWHQFIVLHLALTRIGAITSNIAHVYRHLELRGILGLTEAKAVAVPAEFRGFDYRQMMCEVRPQLPNLKHVVVVGGHAPAGMVSYDELTVSPGSRRIAVNDLSILRPDPNAVTHIAFTSGTSGEPKGAMHTSNTLGAMSASDVRAHNLSENDVFFVSAPLGYNLGFYSGVRTPVSVGGKIVLLETWSVPEALELIAKEGATYTMSATSMLQDVVYSPDLERFNRLPTLRTYVVGAAPVPPSLVADAGKLLPNLFVSTGYGMTECGQMTYVQRSAPRQKVIESDGRPAPGTEMKMVGPDGEELPTGDPGEIVVRSAQRCLGYFKRPDLDSESYFADGFFRTGDQARMDEDGYIRITGRIKDLIIRGGANISPVEIENILITHPKIDRVAVIGIPDIRLGERVCACVVLKAGQTLGFEEAVEWVAQAGVAKVKWPQRLEVLDELPTSAIGKVLKSALRQQVAAKMAEDQ